LNVRGSGGPGDPWVVETYEGIATEAPDTRPGPADRFIGMRVYTTDTKRIFLWDGFNWRCIHQPLMVFTPTIISGLTLGTGGQMRTGYARYAHRVHYEGEIFLGTGFVINQPKMSLPVSSRHADPASGPRTVGTAGFFDINTGQIFHGTSDIHWSAPTNLVFYCPGPTTYPVTSTAPFTWVAGDELWWSIEYEAAETV
jgi:hypothetical protein